METKEILEMTAHIVSTQAGGRTMTPDLVAESVLKVAKAIKDAEKMLDETPPQMPKV